MPARKFLAPQARQGDGHGYTNRPQRPLPEVPDSPELVARIHDRTALCDEPEAPSGAWIEAQYDLARTYDRMRHLAQVEQAHRIRACLSLEARMTEAHRRAKLQRVDVSGELYVIRQMLERARRGGRGEPPAAVDRLSRVEATLDYRPDLEDAA